MYANSFCSQQNPSTAAVFARSRLTIPSTGIFDADLMTKTLDLMKHGPDITVLMLDGGKHTLLFQ